MAVYLLANIDVSSVLLECWSLVLDLVLNVGDLEFSFSFPFLHRSYSFANQLVGPK